jgi:adenylate cyclase
MFLDMKSSTKFAEQLGHVRYFELLREYYSDLSNAIINNLGEVYQYIGDEVVITWRFNKGLMHNHCLKCFFAMKRDLEKRTAFYQRHFGVVPTFKAGMHIGKVTVGEIGALKKEIFFTGDVLNVTSRIQGLCNEYHSDLLLSADLANQLNEADEFKFTSLGQKTLKGRSVPLELVRVEEMDVH